MSVSRQSLRPKPRTILQDIDQFRMSDLFVSVDIRADVDIYEINPGRQFQYDDRVRQINFPAVVGIPRQNKFPDRQIERIRRR